MKAKKKTARKLDELGMLSRCRECLRYIVAEDDDAHVCIQCGGRNRRMFKQGASE